MSTKVSHFGPKSISDSFLWDSGHRVTSSLFFSLPGVGDLPHSTQTSIDLKICPDLVPTSSLLDVDQDLPKDCFARHETRDS